MLTFISNNWKNLFRDTLSVLSILWLGAEIIINACSYELKIPISWLIFAIAILFIIVLINAYFCNKKKTFKINNNNITIMFGDIFKENDLKVIAFNEYFDTKVDGKIISPKTLNGIVINKGLIDITNFDEDLQNCPYLKPDKENIKRINGGKTARYKLGSCFKHNNIIAVAFSKFDKNDNANLTLQEYYECLLNFWKELNRVYNSNNLVIPLLGSGITRIENGDKLSAFDKLCILLHTLKISGVTFSKDINITFIINEKDKDEIKLYNLRNII